MLCHIALVLSGTVLQSRSISCNCLDSSLLLRSTQSHCCCLCTIPKERCAWGSGPLGGQNQLKKKKKLLFDARKIMYCPLWKNKLLWWQRLCQVRDGHSAQRTAWAADGNHSCISLTYSPIVPLRKISYLRKEVTYEKAWQHVTGFQSGEFYFLNSILTLVFCLLPLNYFRRYFVYYCIYSLNEGSLGSDMSAVWFINLLYGKP